MFLRFKDLFVACSKRSSTQGSSSNHTRRYDLIGKGCGVISWRSGWHLNYWCLQAAPIYMCACIYVYMNMYTHMYVYVLIHMYVSIYTYIYGVVCVLLCFIKPMLGNRDGPGFHHERAKGDTPTIQDRRHPSSPCPPLDNLGFRILTLCLNYVVGYTDPLLFLCERTHNYYV